MNECGTLKHARAHLFLRVRRAHACARRAQAPALLQALHQAIHPSPARLCAATHCHGVGHAAPQRQTRGVRRSDQGPGSGHGHRGRGIARGRHLQAGRGRGLRPCGRQEISEMFAFRLRFYLFHRRERVIQRLAKGDKGWSARESVASKGGTRVKRGPTARRGLPRGPTHHPTASCAP